MDSSKASIDGIEAQSSTSHGQQKVRYSPWNLIKNCLCTLSTREGTPPKGDIESVPEFLTNLKFSDFFDFPGEYVVMSPEIFSAVSAGNKECLEKLSSYGTHMKCLKSNRGDFVLHLAAASGNLDVVKSIVYECPCLLLESNSKAQTPLHVAARAGHSNVVEAFVAVVTFVSAKLSEEEKEILNLYVLKDIDGNTALHLAVKNCHTKTATCLVYANQRASFLEDSNGKSPLYLVVEAGNNVSLVNAMFKTTGNNGLEGSNSNLDSLLKGRKSLVHAALKANSTAIIDAILNEYPSLEDMRDEEGWTCLSFGAYIGYYEGVCNLLDRSTKSVYVCNDDGSFPIHMAAMKGHTSIVKEILKRCPDSKQLLNKYGQNILHIAANVGNASLVYHLVKRGATIHLGFEQDVDGNTPLHLATINYRPRTIFILNRGFHIKNDDGLTALDIAESYPKDGYILEERVTLMVVVFRYARHLPHLWKKRLTKRSAPLDPEKSKEYINALLLVAALVATVTFAAGFTIPGGFNNSAPKLGMATLANDSLLFTFLVFDTLALLSSVAAIAALIWAQMGDPALVQKSLTFALSSLSFALFCLPMSFLYGVSVTFQHVQGIVYFLSSTTTIYFTVMVIILGPHVTLQIPGIPAVFGLYFLPFLLVASDEGDKVYRASASSTSVKISGKDHVEKQKST